MARFILASTVAVTGLGLLFGGCSGGGGGGSGSTAAPITGLAGSLPSADRSPNGYVFSALSLSATPDGAISALAASGSSALALRAPEDDVLRVSGGSAVSESTFSDPGSSLASVGTTTWAATADRVAQGAAGRVYARNGTSWGLALDTGMPEAYVAATASGALALGGGEGRAGRVWRLGAGAPVEVAALQSGIPVVAASYLDGLYVGGTSNDANGSGARLYRLSGSAVQEVALPFGSGQQGQRQVVTAIMAVDGATGAALSRVLLLAIGSFDLASGQGQGGWVLAGDGTRFEVLSSFGGEAPTCLAWIDRTVYAGTSAGRLVFRDSNGGWVDEPTLPANLGVHSLLAQGTSTLLVGARGAQGARLFTRAIGTAPPPPPSGGSGGGTPTPPPSGGGSGSPTVLGRQVYYQSDVKFLIQSACVSCHGDPNNQAAYSVYSVSRLPDDFASYQATKDHVDTVEPLKSLLLGKITNQIPHQGGAQVQVGDASYNLVYTWIVQGARRDVNGSNPPYNYFTEVKPTVDKGCYGCHFNGAGGYSLAGNYQANYNELLQELDLANPRNSVFIRKLNGQVAHNGGAAFAPGSAEENRIVNWINAGRPFQ